MEAWTAVAARQAAATANVRPGREGQGHMSRGDAVVPEQGVGGGWGGNQAPQSSENGETIECLMEFQIGVLL